MQSARSIELTCPNCDYRFTSGSVGQTSIKGRRRTDVRVHAEGKPLASGVDVSGR
jgi:hypothetical protein